MKTAPTIDALPTWEASGQTWVLHEVLHYQRTGGGTFLCGLWSSIGRNLRIPLRVNVAEIHQNAMEVAS